MSMNGRHNPDADWIINDPSIIKAFERSADDPEKLRRLFDLTARNWMGRVQEGIVEKHQVVDKLQEIAKSTGLIKARGQDFVQKIMSDATKPQATKPAHSSSKKDEEPLEAEVRRLARLSVIKYELERSDIAEQYEIRASVLDKLVEQARPSEENKGQGRSFQIPEIKPWDFAVDGAEVLTEVAAAIRRYVVMSENYGVTALWVMHTFCFDCFQCSPRLAVTSPEKGCGKTTLIDVLRELVARPLASSNATVSAIFRIVEMARPTLLIDEADTFLKVNDELREILNSGHRQGGAVLRTVGDDHEPRQFATFGAAVIAMIGRLPDTLADRSIDISLRRRKSSERVNRLGAIAPNTCICSHARWLAGRLTTRSS